MIFCVKTALTIVIREPVSFDLHNIRKVESWVLVTPECQSFLQLHLNGWFHMGKYWQRLWTGATQHSSFSVFSMLLRRDWLPGELCALFPHWILWFFTVSSKTVFCDVSTFPFSWYAFPTNFTWNKAILGYKNLSFLNIKIQRFPITLIVIYPYSHFSIFIGRNVFPLMCLRVFSPPTSLGTFPINYPIPLLFVKHIRIQSLLCISTAMFGYIPKQNRQRNLLSWWIHYDGREKTNNKQ